MNSMLPLFPNGAGSGPGQCAAAVAAVLARLPGLWTAAQMRKQWPSGPAPKAPAIEAALAELESLGMAHRLPGVKQTVLWSARPLEQWLEEAQQRVLQRACTAAAPVPEKKLLAAAWPKPLDPQPLRERLARLERDNRLRMWPGRTASWWHLGPEEAMREALLSALGVRALERKQWLREAKARLRGPSPGQWRQAAAELIAGGRVVVHAARVDGKRVEACSRAEHRGALLEVYRPVIERLLEEWRRLGMREEEIRRFLTSAGRGAASSGALLEELLRLERECPPPNSVARLRRRAALQHYSKEDFDAAALELLRQGRVYMAPHDHPMRLPEQERNDLVSDGAGSFYVSISARK